ALRDNERGLWCTDYNDIIHFSDDTAYKYMSVEINRFMSRGRVTEKDHFILTSWWNHDKVYRSRCI
ncbi:MAG: hypothetical protein LBH72_06420, partial [Proteiniphilum sp.]|nr:hypothetical protein [Proteiniphilum sp.]